MILRRMPMCECFADVQVVWCGGRDDKSDEVRLSAVLGA